MSYNVNRSFYLNGQLTIKVRDVLDLKRKYQEVLAENNLLDYLETDLHRNLGSDIVIENPSWCGDFSGWCYSTFIAILSHTKGKADICLVWEGGDSITGLRVEDGLVTKCKVVMALQPE